MVFDGLEFGFFLALKQTSSFWGAETRPPLVSGGSDLFQGRGS